MPLQKYSIEVQRSAVVREYKFIGGVDLRDMLLELYRIDMAMRRWHFCIGVLLLGSDRSNCWLLHDCVTARKTMRRK